MLGLRDLQQSFADAIISGDFESIAALIHGGTLAPEEGLLVHRNTRLGALAGALRLSFPAVDALVGADFFEQTVAVFARQCPPRAALLSFYGAEFPAFLAGYSPASTLPYLADVARLEWALDEAARAPEIDKAAPVASAELTGATLTLAPSLRLLAVGYPAEAIWRAVLMGDDDALSSIDPGAAAGHVAIWRDGDGADAKPLGRAAAAFIDSLLAGSDAESAIARACAADPAGDPVAAIANEILPAGFTHLTLTP